MPRSSKIVSRRFGASGSTLLCASANFDKCPKKNLSALIWPASDPTVPSAVRTYKINYNNIYVVQ